MTDHGDIRPGEKLDWKTLEAHLRRELPELKGEMTVAQFHGGHANLTYLLRFGERELVLRRPPFGKLAPGAHDMRREYRVLSKLNEHFPPAPRAFLLGTDPAIIGSDFVVMERRTGVVVRYRLPAEFGQTAQAEQRLSDALIRVCAELHAVDPYATGLGELGKPDDFAARQLSGWTKRWQLSRTTENRDMDRLALLLAGDIPAPQRVSIVHGDLKFDNCQFQPENPDRVTAVFDWDMATLGDPLVDLAGLLSFWPDPAIDPEELPIPLLVGEWPDKDHLRQHYAAFSGLDLGRMAWYEGLAYFKTAVIAQQLYARYVAGATKDERMEKFGRAVAVFAGAGVRRLS